MTLKIDNQIEMPEALSLKQRKRNLLLLTPASPEQSVAFESLVRSDRPANQLRPVPESWASEVKALRQQVIDAYTLPMPVSPARRSVETILGDFIAQGILLPHPEVTAKNELEFKVDARMPDRIYHSEQSSVVRRRFYALYRESQLFVDLRLQPQNDGE